jgi:hypothetical protein
MVGPTLDRVIEKCCQRMSALDPASATQTRTDRSAISDIDEKHPACDDLCTLPEFV